MKKGFPWLEVILVGSIAACTATSGVFGGKEAFEYVDAHILFWIRSISAIIAATALAIKALLSTPFAGYFGNKDDKGKPPPEPPAQSQQPPP